MDADTIAIMQPTFNPWLGFFDMIDQSDAFVLYDDVQLARRSWQVRNRIKTNNGELFLTIPVKKTKHRDDLLIMDAQINEEEKWRKKHLGSLSNTYRKAPFFNEVYPFLEEYYGLNIQTLGYFNGRLIKAISERIGITTDFLFSSEMDGLIGQKDIRLLSICKQLGASTYLSAQGSAIYIESERQGGELGAAGIEVIYHFYDHPEYPQLHGDFISHLGIFDLLFNIGFDEALDVIRKGRMATVPSSIYRTQYMQ